LLFHEKITQIYILYVYSIMFRSSSKSHRSSSKSHRSSSKSHRSSSKSHKNSSKSHRSSSKSHSKKDKFENPFKSNNFNKKVGVTNLLQNFVDYKTKLRNYINIFLFLIETAYTIQANVETKSKIIFSAMYTYCEIKRLVKDEKQKNKKKKPLKIVDARNGKIPSLTNSPSIILIGGKKNKTSRKDITGGGIYTTLRRWLTTNYTRKLIKNSYNKTMHYNDLNSLKQKIKKLPKKYDNEDLKDIDIHDYNGLVICQLTIEEQKIFEILILNLYLEKAGSSTALGDPLIKALSLEKALNEKQSDTYFDSSKDFDPENFLNMFVQNKPSDTVLYEQINIPKYSIVILKEDKEQYDLLKTNLLETEKMIMTILMNLIPICNKDEIDKLQEEIDYGFNKDDERHFFHVRSKERSFIKTFEKIKHIIKNHLEEEIKHITKLEIEEDIDLRGGKKNIVMGGNKKIKKDIYDNIKKIISENDVFSNEKIYTVIGKSQNNNYTIRNKKGKNINKNGKDLIIIEIFKGVESMWEEDFIQNAKNYINNYDKLINEDAITEDETMSSVTNEDSDSQLHKNIASMVSSSRNKLKISKEKYIEILDNFKKEWDKNLKEIAGTTYRTYKKSGTKANQIMSNINNLGEIIIKKLDDNSSGNEFYDKFHNEDITNEMFVYFCIFTAVSTLFKHKIIAYLSNIGIGIAYANMFMAIFLIWVTILLLVPNSFVTLIDGLNGKFTFNKSKIIHIPVLSILSYLTYVMYLAGNECNNNNEETCFMKMVDAKNAFIVKNEGLIEYDGKFENTKTKCTYPYIKNNYWYPEFKGDWNARCVIEGKNANIDWKTWSIDVFNSIMIGTQKFIIGMFENAKFGIATISTVKLFYTLYHMWGNSIHTEKIYSKLIQEIKKEISEYEFDSDSAIKLIEQHSKEIAENGGPGGLGNVAKAQKRLANFNKDFLASRYQQVQMDLNSQQMLTEALRTKYLGEQNVIMEKNVSQQRKTTTNKDDQKIPA